MKPPLTITRLFALAVVVLAWTSLTASHSAAQPAAPTTPASFLANDAEGVVRFPTKKKNALGWTMQIRHAQHATAEVTRIEIEFATTGGPTTADLNLSIQLTPKASGHETPQSASRVSLPITIPQGTNRQSLVRYAPKTSFGNLYEVQLFQDGRKIDDCKDFVGESLTRQDAGLYLNLNLLGKWNVLWINSEEDRTTRSQSFENLLLGQEVSPFYSVETPDEWDKLMDDATVQTSTHALRAIDIDQLPNHWLAYQPYDSLIIHHSDWLSLKEQQTAPARAIRQWVNAGGVVLVRGISLSETIPSDEKTTTSNPGSAPTPDSIANANTIIQQRIENFDGYSIPDNTTFQSEVSYMDLSDSQIREWREWFPTGAQTLKDSLAAFPPARLTSQTGVRSQSQLAGMVIYLGKQPIGRPIEVLQWQAASSLMGWQSHRILRAGVEPILGSSRFFQWVIPGVAQPPVYTFMGLLGIFVILVGPVAYRKTAKSGRGYLMFAIAPLLAIITTLAMLAYGVIADGFGTTTRVRQITWVDGETGDAVTRTRSTYFAGIRPSDGLTFENNTDVTLFPDNHQRSWESQTDDRFQLRGEIVVTDKSIQFSRDYLPSRQQKQFVAHRPQDNWGYFTIEGAAPASSNEVQIQSHANQPANEMIVRDTKGSYFYAENIPPNEIVKATRLTDQEASERLGELYQRQWLVSSIVDRRQSQTSSMQNYNNEVFDIINQQLNNLSSAAKPTDGAFEFELQSRLQLGSKLPRNSFFCLTDLSPDAIAIDNAVPTDSIHFVMGSLR
ncbi:hypothetical protein SAMN06265222_11845 [Neorhodopirellula lusitana]|uniref:Uncharacterized protein n=1 Tax=Neorhodopirellula lusitana TaxID=445327 RepID=A0ABY1QMA3_9BACT|nr:hypothetical protein [Neorhodopirellula lusitana]SMP74811.1 hypothetical protein SAMN06265222_11845 [Neorhodopirellula lusitana]